MGNPKPAKKSGDPETASYSAPALEKGLDILELLCRSDVPLSQKEIGQRLGRSVGELYRMVACLVERGYLVNADEKLHITTKLFELAHTNRRPTVCSLRPRPSCRNWRATSVSLVT